MILYQIYSNWHAERGGLHVIAVAYWAMTEHFQKGERVCLINRFFTKFNRLKQECNWRMYANSRMKFWEFFWTIFQNRGNPVTTSFALLEAKRGRPLLSKLWIFVKTLPVVFIKYLRYMQFMKRNDLWKSQEKQSQSLINAFYPIVCLD